MRFVYDSIRVLVGFICILTVFSSCATFGPECGKGLGIGWGDPSGDLWGVIIGSPAHKAGVVPGGYIQVYESTNFPPKNKTETVLVVQYPTEKKTYRLEQAEVEYCGEVWLRGSTEKQWK